MAKRWNGKLSLWMALVVTIASRLRCCKQINGENAFGWNDLRNRSTFSPTLGRASAREDALSPAAFALPSAPTEKSNHFGVGFRRYAAAPCVGGADASSTRLSSSIPPLTVILPAYNEADRIVETIRTYRSYVEQSRQWGRKQDTSRTTSSFACRSNILVVNDGSTDDTAAVVADEFGQDPDSGQPAVQCLSLKKNCGKGMAIAQGIRFVSQEQQQQTQQPNDCRNNIGEVDKEAVMPRLILIADADGSGSIEDVESMVSAMISLLVPQKRDSSLTQTAPMATTLDWNRLALVVGDRGYRGTSTGRAILRWGFRTCARLLCGSLMDGTVGGVRDTQCGMKLMTLPAAQRLYRDLHLCRWSHDVEVAYRAGRYNENQQERGDGLAVGNVPIQWNEKEGSKLLSLSSSSSSSSSSWISNETSNDGIAGVFISSQDKLLNTVNSFGRTLQISSIMFWDVLQMRINYELGIWK